MIEKNTFFYFIDKYLLYLLQYIFTIKLYFFLLRGKEVCFMFWKYIESHSMKEKRMFIYSNFIITQLYYYYYKFIETFPFRDLLISFN